MGMSRLLFNVSAFSLPLDGFLLISHSIMTILITILVYFACLLGLSRLIGSKGDNSSFFSANHCSPWYMVAFGMIGASISGVTFVSVPGMVLGIGMTYLQMCIGFIFGYITVAFLLLPVYYRFRQASIYAYLRHRFGRSSHKTAASFFLVSKMTGSAVKFYVVCMILQRFVLDAYGVPFAVTAILLVALIWLYTQHGGIQTLVWTDSFQTFCMFAALLLIIYKVILALGLSPIEAFGAVLADEHSRVFVFDDWISAQNFWKQFVSGVFIVIVMTGLDQDMMQKNLTCKSLREAQKDMCSYGLAFLPANALFLGLGVLLMMLAQKQGIALPEKSDELMLMFVANNSLGESVAVFFAIGIVAACFSSADSALTSLTTSFCVDICGRTEDERLRKRVHVLMAAVFALFIVLFQAVNSTNLIDAIYTIVSYTYGPLLGLFAFGIMSRRKVRDRFVPYVCVAAPLLCYCLERFAKEEWGYAFGYELLLVNGLLTIIGLVSIARRRG